MEAVAKLRNNPTSTRKMRLLADLIRGMDVEKALSILKYHPKHPSVPLEKLLVSAISNWKQKNETDRVEDAGLYVKTIFVDGGRTLKRMRPAPQGRGYRVRKRSNHVTIIVDGRVALTAAEPVKEEKTVAEKAPVEKAPAKAPKAKPETKSGEAKPAAKKKAATKKS